MKHLMAIQSELKAPKGQYNSFGKYKYRSAEDILEAVKPLLFKHGCLLTLTDEIVSMDGRFYVKAIAKLKTPDDEFVVTAYAREDEAKKGMDGSQITGTASSYSRKYCLNGLFLIDDTKDADTDEHRIQTEVNEEPADRGELKARIMTYVGAWSLDADKVFKKARINGLDDLATERLKGMLDWLNSLDETKRKELM